MHRGWNTWWLMMILKTTKIHMFFVLFFCEWSIHSITKQAVMQKIEHDKALFSYENVQLLQKVKTKKLKKLKINVTKWSCFLSFNEQELNIVFFTTGLFMTIFSSTEKNIVTRIRSCKLSCFWIFWSWFHLNIFIHC